LDSTLCQESNRFLPTPQIDRYVTLWQGRGEGFYVWRFVGENTVSTHDYLQDDFADAKICALHEWGVPESARRPPSSLKDSRLRAARRGTGQ
jgi:hypothetical protein